MTTDKMVNLPMIVTGKSNTGLNKKMKSMQTMGGFEMIRNSKGSASLKNTFDALDLIPEFDENRYKNVNLQNEDILKKKPQHNNDKKGEEDLKQINHFNLTIMTDAKWGNEDRNFKTSIGNFPLNMREKKLKKDISNIFINIALLKKMQKTQAVGFFK
jgi:hypothetical protein